MSIWVERIKIAHRLFESTTFDDKGMKFALDGLTKLILWSIERFVKKANELKESFNSLLNEIKRENKG